MSIHQVTELRCDINTDMDQEEEKAESNCAFLNIPVEIFLYICSFLDARFISNSLSLVCKQFNEILSDNSLWKYRVGKHYDGVYPALPLLHPDDYDWKGACANIEDEFNLWHNKEKDMKRILLKDIHYASVDAVLLTKCGQLCFSGSRDHNLVAWDVQAAEAGEHCRPKAVLENAHKGWIWNLDSFNGKLFSCSWDATVKAWDMEGNLKEISVFVCRAPALDMACWCSLVAVALFNRRVVLFDSRSGRKEVALYKAHTGAVLALATVDRCIVSASEDRSVLVWDQRAAKVLKRICFADIGLGSHAYPMRLSYANGAIYIGDVKGQVHLMDPSRGEFSIVQSYDVGHTGKVTGVRHTAGSVMTCSSDGTMRVLAPTSKLEPIALLKSRGGEITNFDYKNNILAMGSTDNFVEVWMPKSE